MHPGRVRMAEGNASWKGKNGRGKCILEVQAGNGGCGPRPKPHAFKPMRNIRQPCQGMSLKERNG
eukprot:1150367-Pelagomonas_calceolata.AAC.2